MSDRFSKLYELQRNLYSEGSPVIVSAGALLKDTQTSNVIVQLKFHGISATAIKALKVGITAFDIAGKEIAGVSEYQYLDLNIQNGQEFGSNKAIVMPDPVTRSFAINSMTIVLADGHVQNVRMPLSPLPQPAVIQSVLTGAELVNQYRLKTNDRAAYVPQESTGLWQCHCGQWNGYSVCSKCRGQKSTAFAALDLPTLTNEMKVRLAEEAQKKAESEQRAVLERQEKEKQLAIKEEHRKATAKKTKKALAIVVPVLVLVIAFVTWVYPDVIKPNMMYEDASALLLDGQYDAATTAFLELGDYKDAQQMSLESQYQKAEQFLAEQLYEDAINTFGQLTGYKDSSERIAQINELLLSEQYEYAMSLFEDSVYEDAGEVFKTLGEYKDSKTQMQECYYRLGKSYIANSQTTEAIAVLKAIPRYKDSDSLLKSIYDQMTASGSVLDFFSMFKSGMTQEEVLSMIGEGYSRYITTSSRRSVNYLNSEPQYILDSYLADWIQVSFYEEKGQELFTGTLSHISWWHETSGKQLEIYDDVYQYLCLYLGEPDSKEIDEEDYTVTWGNIELWVFYRDSDNTTVINLAADY